MLAILYMALPIGTTAAPPLLGAQARGVALPPIELFTRAGCPRCAAARRLVDRLQREDATLRVVIVEIDRDPVARQRLQALSTQAGIATPGVPSFAFGERLLVGYRDEATTERALRALVAGDAPDGRAAATCAAGEAAPCEALPAAAEVDSRLFGRLSIERIGLPVFSVALGLLDGFNPCAMWVLLFLLSLLVNLHDRRAMALIAGTFVLVSGVVYFTFLSAWLNVFLLIGVSRPVQMAMGLVAAAVGAINVKDFFAFRRGLSLTIPEAAKPGLYDRMRHILRAQRLAASLLGAAALAVVVNMVELLCTAGLPAIYTSILASQALPAWQHYGHLLLYTLAYVADDALMVGLAVAALGHRRLTEHEGRWLKLISGGVMLGLATWLLFWPEALS